MKEQLLSLRDTFLKLPMPTRVIGGSMVVAIAIGLWLLASGTGRSPSMERLFSSDSMTDDEITKVLAAFSAARLNGWKVDYNRIYVPASARDEYYRAAQDAGALPLREQSLIESAMAQASPLDSDSRRKAMENHAKERELGRRIGEFPEVLRATVLYDSMKRGFAADHRQSASVIVTPKGANPLRPEMIRAIKELVRSSYAGMTADDVTVTDVNARGAVVLSETDDLFQERVKWEDLYRRKAAQLLQAFGPLSIDATVEIDPTMATEKAKLKIDPQGSTIQEQSASTNSEVNRPQPAGAPGAQTNGVGNQSRAIDPAQMQVAKTTQKNESIVKVPGEEFETTKLAGFLPKRVSFSIGVPESYYEKIRQIDFLRSNPTATAADVPPLTVDERTKLKAATAEQIRNAISTMLMEGPAGEDRFPLVEVWDHRDLPELPLTAPSATDKAISWLADSWQTLAMIGLAVVALLMVRGVSKIGAGAPRPDFEEGFGLELPKPPVDEMEEDDGDGGPKLTITGQHLKQELTQLVGSNPEAAANVLRKWLDGAAA